jgi:DNA invertase Pin-like site-specific DNA recombinase
MKKDGKEKGAITINPERTLTILRHILKDENFLKDGLDKMSFYKIDNELRSKFGITKSKRTLMSFMEDYPRLLEFVEKVQGMKFFKRLSLLKIQPDKLLLGKERLLAEGKPITLGPHPPVGYKIVNGVYELDMEKVSLAKQLFETVYNGGNFQQLCRENDLNRVSARRMIQDPIYVGIIKYRGKEYHFPSLAMIDEKLWKACQSISYRRPTFGFMRKEGKTIKNPETAPKVVRIFDSRLKNLTFAEIGRMSDINMPPRFIRDIIRNPTYANKRKILGKPPNQWPDAGVEATVSFEVWLKAQKVLSDRSPWSLALEAKKKKETENRNWLLAYIATLEPKGVRLKELKELAQKMERSESQLKRYLRDLKGQGLIQKKVRHWHIKGERDAQREMICKIYRLRQQRKSLREIAGALGISTTPVRRILRNPNYKDIVGEELWEAVQKIESEPQQRAE